ncbi:hypothetical protein PsYK624_084990 [Phanerochaete sordida]|uniref:Uncharacterized protein n=1 Tax=Phanerochaete sordida TaxID=48140 RepID=A0A9P3GCU1_9APHY|nr:hypothetical protein PsYK624_084990 [Phanerochaete sordida]
MSAFANCAASTADPLASPTRTRLILSAPVPAANLPLAALPLPMLSPVTPPWLGAMRRTCKLVQQTHLSPKKRQRHVRALRTLVDAYAPWVIAHGGPAPLAPALECMLEYGDGEDKVHVARSLEGWYAAMARSPDCQTLLLKILESCPSAHSLVFGELVLYGVLLLLLHCTASGVLLAAYDAHADEDERASIVRGLHGHVACQVAERRGSVRSLGDALRECRQPGEAYLILGATKNNLLTIFNQQNPVILSSALFHRALCEYLQALHVLPKQLSDPWRSDVVPKCMEHVGLLALSADGTRIIEEINSIVENTMTMPIMPPIMPTIDMESASTRLA